MPRVIPNFRGATFKILSPKQAQAALRAVAKKGGLPHYYGCKIIRKTSSKALPFGELPRGVSMEICREISGGKDVITARVHGPKGSRSKVFGLGNAGKAYRVRYDHHGKLRSTFHTATSKADAIRKAKHYLGFDPKIVDVGVESKDGYTLEGKKRSRR